jgi:kynurenine formamidase
VTLSTHNGTHLDAPWHFHPTMDGGARAITIDEVPLDWCFRPAVKLDFRHFADGYVVTAADVASELERVGHALQPLDIVLVNTAAGKAVGDPNFVNIGCGMGYEATMYLTSRGVRVTGTDAWSWDAPFSYTAQRVAESGDTSLIWEGHKAGRDIGYCHLEKLHNLEVLPPHVLHGGMLSAQGTRVPRPAGRARSRSSRSEAFGALRNCRIHHHAPAHLTLEDLGSQPRHLAQRHLLAHGVQPLAAADPRAAGSQACRAPLHADT